MELPHFNKNSFCCAQEDICSANRLRIPLKGYSSILHLGNFISKPVYFSFQYCLQTKMAGSNQFICFHSNSPKYIVISLYYLLISWLSIFLYILKNGLNTSHYSNRPISFFTHLFSCHQAARASITV